jgi:hypothetical protein
LDPAIPVGKALVAILSDPCAYPEVEARIVATRAAMPQIQYARAFIVLRL